MPWFEDIREGAITSWGERGDILLACWCHYDLLDVVQQRPWTMAKVRVFFNEVAFEGVGFARQRQYTSLEVYRLSGKWLGLIPRFRVVLARRDRWDPAVGVDLAVFRAISDAARNVLKAYRRWVKGHLALPPKYQEGTRFEVVGPADVQA